MNEPEPPLDDQEEDEAPLPPAATPRRALAIAGGTTVLTAIALGVAFRPERASETWILGVVGLVYLVLGGVALARLRARGELRDVMRPAGGDLTLGALTAALLYGVAMAVTVTLTRHGTPREAWIASIYHLLGDPSETSYHVTSAAIFVVAALEEIAWRGLVMRALGEPFGAGRAWIGATLLYALAHLPTALLLRDVIAGPNPLLIVGALGCGFVWGYLANRTGRLLPAVFAHALFTWALVEFPLWRP